MIEKFFTEEQCNTMLNAAEQCRQNKGPTHDYPEYGVQRCLHADNIDELKVFFNNKFVENVAQLYIGRKAKKFQCMYEIKGRRNKESVADTPILMIGKKGLKPLFI